MGMLYWNRSTQFTTGMDSNVVVIVCDFVREKVSKVGYILIDISIDSRELSSGICQCW